MFALGADGLRLINGLALVAEILLAEEGHGEMNAAEITARNLQVAGLLRSAGQYHGVEARHQLGRRHIHPHMAAGAEGNALLAHLVDPAFHNMFFQLEVGNTVAQEPARIAILFEHRHLVTGAGELLGTGQPRWPGAHHGNGFSGLIGPWLGRDPAFLPAALGDVVLHVLDGYGLIDDVEGAGFLARRRTDTPRELGKIVGGMKHFKGAAPLSPVHKVVPVRYNVVDRTALMTEGNATIHTARGLLDKGFFFLGKGELPVIGDALDRWQGSQFPALDFKKTGEFTHGRAVLP